MPKPTPDESKDDFISRCMSHGETRQKYPNQDQRFAVCNSLWSAKVEKSDFSKAHNGDTMTCACGGDCCTQEKVAAEPEPLADESHEEYMARCMDAGYSEDECMIAHEGHDFKEAATCPPGQSMQDGYCKPISVTIELDIDDICAYVEAETGNTLIEITGIAFHEGYNKNKWSLSRAGAEQVMQQMIGADVTLKHPSPDEHSPGFSRNMDGGVEEAVVGVIKEATIEDVPGGWNVRYKAHIMRTELFESLESGLWTRENYGVSIGGYGVPTAESDDGVIFGSDFTFDHLAIVHKPAYPRANIETVERIEASEDKEVEAEETLNYESRPSEELLTQESSKMTDENVQTEDDSEIDTLSSEIESLKADMVLRDAAIAEYEARDASRAEADRVALVEKATEIGLKGHEDFSEETLNSVIASWESSRPTFEAATPAQSEPEDIPVEASASEQSQTVVANYLNGVMVESSEDIYERAYNAWASAWNKTLSGIERNTMAAKSYNEIKEQI